MDTFLASIIVSASRLSGGQAQRSPPTPTRDSVDFALARPPYRLTPQQRLTELETVLDRLTI